MSRYGITLSIDYTFSPSFKTASNAPTDKIITTFGYVAKLIWWEWITIEVDLLNAGSRLVIYRERGDNPYVSGKTCKLTWICFWCHIHTYAKLNEPTFIWASTGGGLENCRCTSSAAAFLLGPTKDPPLVPEWKEAERKKATKREERIHAYFNCIVIII